MPADQQRGTGTGSDGNGGEGEDGGADDGRFHGREGHLGEQGGERSGRRKSFFDELKARREHRGKKV